MLRDREAGNVLCRNLQRGDHVIVVKPDRIFRNLSDCLVILDQLDRIGARLHVCDFLGQSIDLTRWIGRPHIRFLAVFANLERTFIAERSRETTRARRARREGAGRPHLGFK
jgi:DNA invertase Pin-like site-specific DNA recombinase